MQKVRITDFAFLVALTYNVLKRTETLGEFKPPRHIKNNINLKRQGESVVLPDLYHTDPLGCLQN